ncbi:MAG TPA: CBS domain-containing protein [Nitrosopumilaceae archaeon]|nr:CBS domain-containing protein [Nitrosopumilaceae archaeon]
MNSDQSTYEYVKEVQKMPIRKTLHPATIVEPSFSISKVIDMMSKTDSYDVYCMNEGTVLTTNAREILTVRDISTMKISSLLHKIRTLSKDDTIEKAATAMAHYRMRSFPVTDNGHLIGVVTAKNVVNLLSRQNLKWIRANSVLTPNPLTLSSAESLAKARKIMTTNRIDHIPILHKGKISHVLTSMHLLQTLTPPERIGSDQKGINMHRRLESDIGNVGSPRIPQCNTNDSISTIMDTMLKTNTTCCLLTLWDNLHGIITYKDILNLLVTKIKSEIPLYIVGMPSDMSNAEIVKTKFQKIIKNLIKVYPEVEEARTSIKSIHSPLSKRQHFEVSIRISTPYKTYNYKELGWDLSQVFDALGKSIVRNLSKRSKRRWKTSIRKIDKKNIF